MRGSQPMLIRSSSGAIVSLVHTTNEDSARNSSASVSPSAQTSKIPTKGRYESLPSISTFYSQQAAYTQQQQQKHHHLHHHPYHPSAFAHRRKTSHSITSASLASLPSLTTESSIESTGSSTADSSGYNSSDSSSVPPLDRSDSASSSSSSSASLSSLPSLNSSGATSHSTSPHPQTPSTPPNNTKNNSSFSHTTTLGAMDPSKQYAQSTLLAPLPNDGFLYRAAPSLPILPMNGQYFSVAQQPLPMVSATSPTLYTGLESPVSMTMLETYGLPLQQQSIAPIQFQPYPIELLPGAIPPQIPIAATSPSDTSNASAKTTAKKKYPCPHAVKYNCPDTFTTSGHAARHGKKHTGEKNIHCPVCDKAFTRKDNMKQHERTHRNKGEASKVAADVESKKQQASFGSKSTTSSSTEVEMEDTPPRALDPLASIRAAQQQRRPAPSVVQPAQPSNLTSPTAADIPMPITLESNETLQQVAPSLKPDKNFTNIFDHSFITRSQENILGRPAIFERTISTGSGFSADGEGESPGLDALAMAAELS